MTRATVLALALLVAAPAHAELKNDVAACAVISGDLARLECFDKVAAAAGLAGPQALPTGVTDAGKWLVRHDINPVDDSERVRLVLVADSGTSSRGESIVFNAMCRSNKTEVYIDWKDYLGDDSYDVYEDWKYVTIRIGNAKAVQQRWGISTDSQATFAPNWAGDLLKSMTEADTFLAQVTPYNENPVTAIFDTRGLAVALKLLADTCGWSF